MPYNLLASVSVHAWVACLWSCPSMEARDLLFCGHGIWPIYTTYSQTRMTLLIPPLTPSPVACLCLSFNHITSGFHLVIPLLCEKVVTLWDSVHHHSVRVFLFPPLPRLLLHALRFREDCIAVVLRCLLTGFTCTLKKKKMWISFIHLSLISCVHDFMRWDPENFILLSNMSHGLSPV